jgi:hypothetical protein
MSLDGPFDDRPSRYATDEEWEAAVEVANAVVDMPYMRECSHRYDCDCDTIAIEAAGND